MQGKPPLEIAPSDTVGRKNILTVEFWRLFVPDDPSLGGVQGLPTHSWRVLANKDYCIGMGLGYSQEDCIASAAMMIFRAFRRSEDRAEYLHMENGDVNWDKKPLKTTEDNEK